MTDSQSPEIPSQMPDRRARLRRRLVGGAFTAFLAVEAIAAASASAATTPKEGDSATPASLEARADGLRAAQSSVVAGDDHPERALMWGNGWFNWGNHWHKWLNNWNNWNNAWNNWVNFSNWSNY